MPRDGATPSEGHGGLREWATRMKNGENPLPLDDRGVRRHGEYDEIIKRGIDKLPSGRFHSAHVFE